MRLRDYQQEALEAVQNALENDLSKQLIVLPTGAGKTIVMAAIAKHFNKRVLFLAHREELIKQAVEKFKLYWPEVDIGICKAKKREISRHVVIGSVQSCCQEQRIQQLKKENFAILMIDEAHHAESKSYQKIIKELGFDLNNKLLLGVTATPQRSDKKQLGNTFDKIVFSRSIGSMIHDGYIPHVLGRTILTSCSLKGVKSKSGDFISKQLASAVNTSDRNAFVIAKYQEHAQGRKSLAFCVNVEHTKALAKAFMEHGIKAAPVWGTMKKEQREKVLHNLHTGAIDIVTSCELLTEGFDEETITAILMARPTKSKSLYIQMVGRGLRSSPGKENCLVLDFTDTGNNLKNIISLKKAIPEAKIIREKQKKKATKKQGPYFAYAERNIVDVQFDILGSKSFLWVENGFGEWSLTDDDGNEIVLGFVDFGYEAKIYFKSGSVLQIVSKPMALDCCMDVCESYAHENLEMKFATLDAPWMRQNNPPTPGQLQFLKSNGVKEQVATRAQAALKIKMIIAKDRKLKRLKMGIFFNDNTFSTKTVNNQIYDRKPYGK